eukprot:6463560-Amphidinium_carterae.1
MLAAPPPPPPPAEAQLLPLEVLSALRKSLQLQLQALQVRRSMNAPRQPYQQRVLQSVLVRDYFCDGVDQFMYEVALCWKKFRIEVG